MERGNKISEISPQKYDSLESFLTFYFLASSSLLCNIRTWLILVVSRGYQDQSIIGKSFKFTTTGLYILSGLDWRHKSLTFIFNKSKHFQFLLLKQLQPELSFEMTCIPGHVTFVTCSKFSLKREIKMCKTNKIRQTVIQTLLHSRSQESYDRNPQLKPGTLLYFASVSGLVVGSYYTFLDRRQ